MLGSTEKNKVAYMLHRDVDGKAIISGPQEASQWTGLCTACYRHGLGVTDLSRPWRWNAQSQRATQLVGYTEGSRSTISLTLFDRERHGRIHMVIMMVRSEGMSEKLVEGLKNSQVATELYVVARQFGVVGRGQQNVCKPFEIERIQTVSLAHFKSHSLLSSCCYFGGCRSQYPKRQRFSSCPVRKNPVTVFRGFLAALAFHNNNTNAAIVAFTQPLTPGILRFHNLPPSQPHAHRSLLIASQQTKHLPTP